MEQSDFAKIISCVDCFSLHITLCLLKIEISTSVTLSSYIFMVIEYLDVNQNSKHSLKMPI